MSGDGRIPAIDVNEYERVNQEWTCGRAAEGTPCARGPNQRGECGAICRPLKVQDRYFCGNAAQLCGRCDDGPLEDGSCSHHPARCVPFKKGTAYVCGLGTCPDGPRPDGTCCQPVPPCRPVRRVLGRRKRLTLFAFALALGSALLMAGGPGHERAMSPGPLTSRHNAVASQCSACHEAGGGGLVDWMHAAMDGADHATLDRKCVECHHEIENQTGQPHNVPPEVLAVLTEEAGKRDTGGSSLMLTLARNTISHHGEIGCAECHHEHRGEHADLTAMTDTQCQVCHASAFASFSVGHPEFVQYPYVRRSRIYFDHVSHYGAHFRDLGRLPASAAAARFSVDAGSIQQTCVECHAADNAGRKMLVRSFDQTCAACHADQIEDDLSEGMLVIALPAFDKKRLGDGQTVTWPFDHVTHPEAKGVLPPVLRLLLSANPDYAKLDRQVASLDLSRLSEATNDQLAAVRTLPELLTDEIKTLGEGGQAGIEARLKRGLGEQVDDADVHQLAKLVRAEAIASMRPWLANEEVGERPSNMRGLALRRRDLSLRYQPQGHADPVLRAWIDVAVRLGRDADEDTPIHQVYRSLTHVSATGRCLKCHTVEERADGSAAVNWQPYGGESLGAFTVFSHRPHLVSLEDDACRQCHVLNQSAEQADSWSVFRPEFVDPAGHPSLASDDFHANFQSIQKAVCARCHQNSSAMESCTTCHAYHVSTSDPHAATSDARR